LAVFFHGKSLPAARTARVAYGGMALFLSTFAACLKRYICVVCVAPAVELSTECVPLVIFVDFAPAFLRYERASACAATKSDGVLIFPGAHNASGGAVCGE